MEFDTEQDYLEYLKSLENKEDKKNYNPLLFTHCSTCGKRIILFIPWKDRKQKDSRYWTCNTCVPENSAARNDMDEPYYTDISKYLFQDEVD